MTRAEGPALRWLALGIALVAYMLGLFHRVAPAAMANDIVTAFAASAAALGTLSATYFWVYTAMQLPSGILADTVGPRRLLVIGGVIAAVGSGMFALAHDLFTAGIGRMLVALGTSVAFVACLKLIASWFEERRFATLTGVVVLAGNLSSAAAGGPFAWLLERASWRSVMLALAGLSALVALAALILVRDAPVHRLAPRAGRWRSDLAAVLGNRATWPIFVANFGLGASFLAFAGLWAVPWLVEVHSMSRVAASQHASLELVGFAVGGLVWGAASDRLGRRKPLFVAGALVHAALWLPLIAGMSIAPPTSHALCLVIGLSGAGLTMSWSCAKEVNAPQSAGMATGVVNLAIFLGPAVVQPLAGWVLDRGPTAALVRTPELWRSGLGVIAGCALLGCAATFFVRETWCRNPKRGARRAGVSGGAPAFLVRRARARPVRWRSLPLPLPCGPVKRTFASAQDAESAFYEALEKGDLEAMMEVWAEDEEIVCVHPGGPRLTGYDQVRESWRQIFGRAQRLKVQISNAVALAGMMLAVHSVHENVTVAGEARAPAPVVATNVYARTPTGWRMLVHHASPMPQAALRTAADGPKILH